jgi:flagellar biosynthesis/type III secretory pathway chaperone
MTILNAAQTQQILELTQMQLDAVRKMLGLLEAEHAALKASDATLIERIASEKVSIYGDLEGLERARLQVLSARLPELDSYDRRGLVMAAAPEHRKSLASTLAALLRQLEKARRQNQVNGAITQLSRQFTQRALATLRGQSPVEPHQPLYGRRGEAIAQTESSAVVAV